MFRRNDIVIPTPHSFPFYYGRVLSCFPDGKILIITDSGVIQTDDTKIIKASRIDIVKLKEKWQIKSLRKLKQTAQNRYDTIWKKLPFSKIRDCGIDHQLAIRVWRSLLFKSHISHSRYGNWRKNLYSIMYCEKHEIEIVRSRGYVPIVMQGRNWKIRFTETHGTRNIAVEILNGRRDDIMTDFTMVLLDE